MSNQPNNQKILLNGEDNDIVPSLMENKEYDFLHEITKDKVLVELAEPIDTADGYVVLPGADPLAVISILVDKQGQSFSLQEGEKGKPLVIYSPKDQKEESPYVGLVREMRNQGMVKQSEEFLYTVVDNIEDIPKTLEEEFIKMNLPETFVSEDAFKEEFNAVSRFASGVNAETRSKRGERQKPDYNVCVFCSASTKDETYLNMGEEVGRTISEAGFGMVFGGSNAAVMGTVAKGAYNHEDGYVTGVTTPIFAREELMREDASIHIDNLILEKDIYKRMTRMFDESDMLVVLPGGLGTVQETLSLARSKQKDPALKDKPIVLYNEGGFWDPFKDVLKEAGMSDDIKIVSSKKELDLFMKRDAHKKGKLSPQVPQEKETKMAALPYGIGKKKNER